MIVITGASGNLGRLVVNELAEKVDRSQIVATARSTEKIADLAAAGITVRELDYAKPDTIASALDGATQVLLISSSEIGQRMPQHQAVIDAAVAAGVEHIAYTSVLRADTSGVMIAGEHKATEAALAASGLTTSLLRNGWYIENYTENLAPALAHGALIGSAGDGRVAAATRADLAAAAASVLADQELWGSTYELGGPAFTMSELAATVSKTTGASVTYVDMEADAYKAALGDAGLPPEMAEFLADADLGIKRGELDIDPSTLERLVGRPLITLEAAVQAATTAAAG